MHDCDKHMWIQEKAIKTHVKWHMFYIEYKFKLSSWTIKSIDLNLTYVVVWSDVYACAEHSFLYEIIIKNLPNKLLSAYSKHFKSTEMLKSVTSTKT